jgi:hypothetical protein
VHLWRAIDPKGFPIFKPSAAGGEPIFRSDRGWIAVTDRVKPPLAKLKIFVKMITINFGIRSRVSITAI